MLRKVRAPDGGAEESAEESASGFAPSWEQGGVKPEALFSTLSSALVWGPYFPKHLALAHPRFKQSSFFISMLSASKRAKENFTIRHLFLVGTSALL